MTREEYLLYSIKHKCYQLRAWVISAFTVTRETDEQKKQSFPGKLSREPFGFFVDLEDGSKVQIKTEKKSTEPLFDMSEKILITREWIPTMTTAIESIRALQMQTSIGRLMVNLIALYEPFEGKFPYWDRKFKPEDVEKFVAPRLQSSVKANEAKKNDLFYVDELIKFQKAVSYLESFSGVFSHSITRQGIQPTPGRKEFRKELIKRYDGKLNDPVEMAKFEEEMKAFDDAYLKSDPSYGKFMTGKVKNARVSGFMTQGGHSNNFTGSMEVTPITQPLEEGIPLDEEGFTAAANTVRYGSFSRGAETVNGGVVAKGMMRSSDNWRITKGDCGSTLGVKRVYNQKSSKLLIGRYVLIQNKPVLIENEEQASQYINRKIIIRSPQYCRRPGIQTCEVCAGVALAKYPTGVQIPLMEMSGGILADSLKQMHNTKLETVTATLSEIIT